MDVKINLKCSLKKGIAIWITIELIGFNLQHLGIQRETESVGLHEGLW